MKKQLFRIIIVIMAAIFSLLVFGSCNDEKSNTSTEESNSTNQSDLTDQPQHYEIELNKDNYEKYIKDSITETTPNSLNKNGNFYEFKGVLTYAYYQEVIVTLDAQYIAPSWEGGETYNFNFSIELDAAGNFSFYTNNQIALDKLNWSYYRPGTRSEIEVIAVSGKVIFDI